MTGIRPRLQHAIMPDEQFRMGIDGETCEQLLQLRPEPVAAQSYDGVELVWHGMIS
jgi:hypothetical protein